MDEDKNKANLGFTTHYIPKFLNSSEIIKDYKYKNL